MKVIIIVRSRGGGQETDAAYVCFNEGTMNNIREKTISRADGKVYVFNGSGFSNMTGEWRYNDLCTELIEIFNEYSDAHYLILFHATDTERDTLLTTLSGRVADQGILNRIRIRRYSTADISGNIWERHLRHLCSDLTKLSERFDNLWNDVWGGQSLEQIQRLRYQILSPLVAHDLIEQALASKKVQSDKVPPGLREEIDEAVRDLDNPIREFCTLASINCDDFRKTLEKLRSETGASGGEQSWKKFHDDLKDVAEKMEAQIEAIGG